tara:strand:+ start:28 stop:501 length:474 start_codon:yes stop_codon:yes gene_type:complete
MKIAIFPGTFNPLTYGHINIAQRASSLFDKVIIAIAKKENEELLLTTKERLSISEDIFSEEKNITPIVFSGLVTDLAREKSSYFIIRGVRTIIDFDYESVMADMNKKLYPEIETVFLMPDEKFKNISSSLVREIAMLGGDISSFVPPSVKLALERKL